MDFVYFALLWVVGGVIGGFLLSNILLIQLFGIPYAKDMEFQKIIDDSRPVVLRYRVSTVILSLIFMTLTVCLFLFVSRVLFIGYALGVGISWLLSLNRFKPTENNISDFVATNHQYMNMDVLGVSTQDEMISRLVAVESARFLSGRKDGLHRPLS